MDNQGWTMTWNIWTGARYYGDSERSADSRLSSATCVAFAGVCSHESDDGTVNVASRPTEAEDHLR